MTDLCPSCREPLHYPSGDGCAAMTMHQPVQKQCTNMVYERRLLGCGAGEVGEMTDRRQIADELWEAFKDKWDGEKKCMPCA
jgi:hypothetical protein